MVMSRRITCLRRLRTIETHRARIGVVVHIQYDVLPLCSVPLTALGRSIRHACAQQSWLCRRPCVSHNARQCHKLQYNTVRHKSSTSSQTLSMLICC